MLELRPNCELCDRDLPPNADDAMICSYECTYCADCVENELQNVCPKCGGGFTPRPIRPKENWRLSGNPLGVVAHPASTLRIDSEFTKAEIQSQSSKLKDIDPRDR